MAHRARTPHTGSALSSVDILVALYFHALRVDPAFPWAASRDRFLLSKGHGCMAHYGVLAERGFFARELLLEYARDGGRLAEHPGPRCMPGVELAAGSLGHGLSVGAGLALAAKRRAEAHRVFVLLSDGECHEGAVWEAAMFAPANQLDNLCAIVDWNRLSALGRSNGPMALEPLAEKWRAFGWSAREVDGHDIGEIVNVLESLPLDRGRPTAVIARTVKGKGVSFMEDELEWHYRPPSDDDLARGLAELGFA